MYKFLFSLMFISINSYAITILYVFERPSNDNMVISKMKLDTIKVDYSIPESTLLQNIKTDSNFTFQGSCLDGIGYNVILKSSQQTIMFSCDDFSIGITETNEIRGLKISQEISEWIKNEQIVLKKMYEDLYTTDSRFSRPKIQTKNKPKDSL